MRRPPITAKGFALVSAGMLALTLAVCACVLTHNARLLMNSAKGSTDNSAAVTGKLSAYLTPEVLRDLHNDLTASIGAGQLTANSYAEVAKSTSNTLDRHVAPGVDRMVASVENRMLTLDGMIRHFDERAFADGGLMPTATATIANVGQLASNLATVASSAGITVAELNTAIKDASEKSGKSLDKIYELLARPEVVEILQHVDGTTLNIQTMSAKAAEAMQKAPGIAESLDKIARTSSRYQKAILISGIIGTLARAFLP